LFSVGNFTNSFKDDIMFYYQGDGNWWDGTFDKRGNLSWNRVGNTKGFGPLIKEGIIHWIADFTRVSHDQFLFYYPGDGHWWLGTIQGGSLSWVLVSSTGH
ncbi:MAG: hypothetical protein KGL95_07390, partial [Patescibacteria group bacterium]|nr:hypothetical protein [Patescibacteria group bacterium]